jgi:hypothetical protein
MTTWFWAISPTASSARRSASLKLEPFTDYPGTMEIIVKKP